MLKKQVEEAEVHFLTKKQFKPVVENNPYIDKVHVLDESISSLVKNLKAEEFDYIIDLHNNLRTAGIKYKLRLIAFSYYKLNIQKWLMVHFKINRLPAAHIVDRYLDTVKLFDVVNDNKGLDYFISENDEVNLNSFPEKFQRGYIAFVIGAKHYTKQMPADKIISVCRKISHPVIFLGGLDDVEKAEIIVQELKGDVMNACGKYNLNQSASLIKQARVVITSDTGLMHIAAAFRKKIISVWGNTIPEFGMSPYLPDADSVIFEVKGLKCRPCSKLGFNKCPKKHFNCMNLIDENGIVEKVQELFR